VGKHTGFSLINDGDTSAVLGDQAQTEVPKANRKSNEE
jgi:hypothetical protein